MQDVNMVSTCCQLIHLLHMLPTHTFISALILAIADGWCCWIYQGRT